MLPLTTLKYLLMPISTTYKFTCYHKYAQQACQHIVVVLAVPSASSQSAEDLPSKVNVNAIEYYQ